MPNPGVDAYIVVKSSDRDGYPPNPGLEVLSGGGPVEECLGFEIEIFDAHTFKRIARSFARLQYRAGALPIFARFFTSGDRDPGVSLQPTPQQMDLYHQDFISHVTVTIAQTVRTLRLGLALPEAGKEPIVPLLPGEGPFAKIKNVAVISAVGDSFTFAYQGGLAGGHHTKAVPIPDWKLDDEIETIVKANLDKRFVVKDVPVDRNALLKISAVALPPVT